MDTELAPGAYRAVESNEDTGNTILGIVELADDGRLKSLVVEKGCDAALADVVNYLNAKASLAVEVAPPPGARPHAVYTQEVTRDEPQIRQAVADYLRKYYSITLEPVPLDLLPVGVGVEEDYRDDPYRPLPELPSQSLPSLARSRPAPAPPPTPE